MKRIAILGCENSHADFFLKFIKENKEFSDVEVVGIYSDERESAEKLRDEFGVPVMDDYADAVGKIDGLIITARHGDNHYKYAKPYIDSGIPMFVDKPITVSESDVTEFMAALKEKGIRVSGGSSLKQDIYVQKARQEALNNEGGKTIGGYVRAPYNADNEYGGFYVYSQHLVEMICEIFGRFPKTVNAYKNGGQIHVLFRYDDFDCVGLLCDLNFVYYVSRMTEEGVSSYLIPNDEHVVDWFYSEFKEFYDLVGGAAQPLAYDEFASPVFILNAIERSLKSGKEEPVGRLTL